jgi:putative transposase
MRSQWRSRWPDGYVHVYNRAVRRLRMFADGANRTYFMWLVARAARKFKVMGVAWALVVNHYHLLLKGSGDALGRMMQEVERLYATRYNEQTGFTGALFEGRYGATWLPSMEAVAYVGRYIHANARDEGVDPALYAWSSAKVYLSEQPVPDWMDPRPVLDWVGGPQAYRAYLAAVPPKRKRNAPQEQAQEAFVTFLEDKTRRLVAGHEALLARCSMPALVSLIAMKSYAIRPRVLAEHFGYQSGRSVSTVAWRMERRILDMPDLRRLLSEVLTLESDWNVNTTPF